MRTGTRHSAAGSYVSAEDPDVRWQASCDKAQNFNTSNHSLDGVYSMTTDGSKVRRLTVNPFPPALPFGGGDSVGDVSPDGRRYVFMRAPTAEVGAGLL